MSVRSVQIFVHNDTDFDLIQDSKDKRHGAWTNDVPPPDKIPAHTIGWWEAESSGFMTGTEGYVSFRFAYYRDADEVVEYGRIYWANPWAVMASNVNGTRVAALTSTSPLKRYPDDDEKANQDAGGSTFAPPAPPPTHYEIVLT